MIAELKQVDPAKAWEYFHAKMQFATGPVELDRLIREHAEVNIVDVRYPEDYDKGHIPGAVNMAKDKWESLQGLRQDKVNVLYCYTQTCHLAAQAGEFFAAKGYRVMEMEGGFEAWKAAELPMEVAPVMEPMRKAA
jgi:rhodanese-related sulfurtransferase